MTKTLTIRLTMTLHPDEFGLHSVSPEAKAWLTKMQSEAEEMDFSMTAEPIVDTPSGLVKTETKRTYTKRKPRQSNTNGAAPEEPVVEAVEVVPTNFSDF